jgi:hypothetical protein
LSLRKYMDERMKATFNFLSFDQIKTILKRRHPMQLELTVQLQQTRTTFLLRIYFVLLLIS